MADTRPTPVSFVRAVRLSLLLLFAPKRFIEIENQDLAARKNYTEGSSKPASAEIVRSAFFRSFVLVIVSAAVGFAGGKVVHAIGRCATPETVAWSQIAGAALLLWGTLFVRGWEIQTYSGVRLTERVNQWLYRFLYCIGTAVLVYSVSFPACRT